MRLLRSVVVVFVAAWLCLGPSAMSALADLGSPMAPVFEPAMAMPGSVAGDGCAEHGHAKKAQTCCDQCPCCVALPSQVWVLISPGVARPIARPLAFAAGLRMAPEPAPPRLQV